MHLDYIVSGANLRAEMYSIKHSCDRASIAEMVVKVHVPTFTPKSGVKIDVTDAEAQARQHEGSVGEW